MPYYGYLYFTLILLYTDYLYAYLSYVLLSISHLPLNPWAPKKACPVYFVPFRSVPSLKCAPFPDRKTFKTLYTYAIRLHFRGSHGAREPQYAGPEFH